MKMKIENGQVIIADVDNIQYQIIKSWNLTRWDKAKKWITGPVSRDLLNKLSELVRLPEPIEAERQRMNEVQRAVDAERMKENPVPLCKFPVKIDLFKHQIRGVNMALITFGLIEPPKQKER